ncbi:hypothetical protein ABB37_01650 [Leptomonas pyrrhocoris]|uniref:Uncharacterized protein n=1 Tax=Leptomonas pyrrhocoris TaxID=157538 RepID=A0A0M9G972_LEPPY|nr:hypothetical protein ABB37_01650 [Leptomonas pyrrhocoris]KPA85317.1 hypothetical protein ABB37_01650 [Leptomonas pyrrhocoris]|eukprot:XP_015663756.1 hypothetical protein ABB37_01650 [Leptomonas pyrrhocoris]
MDIPLHLRLAYAGRFSDPYADGRPTFPNAPVVGHNSSPALQGVSWLSSLVQNLESNRRQDNEAFLIRKRNVADDDVGARSVERAASPREENKNGTQTKDDSPTTTSLPSPIPLRSITAHEACPPFTGSSAVLSLEPLDAEGARSPLQVEIRSPSSTAHVHIAESSTKADDHAHEEPNKGTDATVQADVVVDNATRQHNVVIQAQLVGTHEALLAGVVTSLERRLQECVLKTLALDDANQQLICAFQLPTDTSTGIDVPSRPPVVHPIPLQGFPEKLLNASAPIATPLLSRDGAQSSPAAAANSNPALVANRSERSFSDEAKKELALHLYALRHQVVQMREQLDVHEATHARRLNAMKAAPKDASNRDTVRVEIVKAYPDEPMPYRRGPWRPANFAAASANRRGGRKEGRERGTRDETYSSDDFTGGSSSAADSSGISTETDSSGNTSAESGVQVKEAFGSAGKRGPVAVVGAKAEIPRADSDSSLSSTEGLFRRRQAAALQARLQRTAAATRPKNSYNATTSSTSYSSSDDSYSSRSETSTIPR